MKQGTLKQSFQWAIVTDRGHLAVINGQCPIYWRRQVAEAACEKYYGKGYEVERVTVLAVYR